MKRCQASEHGGAGETIPSFSKGSLRAAASHQAASHDVDSLNLQYEDS